MEEMQADPDPSSEDPATPSAEPSLPSHGTEPVAVVSTARRRGRPLVVGAVVTVIAIVAVLVATVGSGSNADAAIVTAVNSAIAQKGAHVTLTGTVTSAGQTESFNGTGAVDFTNNAMQLAMDVDAGGQQEQAQFLYVESTIYEGLPQIAQLAPGKSWVSIDLGSLTQGSAGGAGQLGGNPLAALHALAANGNAVRPIGASTVDGQSVQGYAVTLNRQAIEKALQSGKVPAWVSHALAQIHSVGATEDVYLDGAGKLVKVSTSLVESVKSAGSVNVQVSYELSDYGTPVSITAPPASEVLSFSQLLQLSSGSQTS
jgi:hypothetical protein